MTEPPGSVGSAISRREVARGLLFDADGRMLMVHWRDPVTGHEFLEPAGGLREPGESFEDTVLREIAEETGIAGVELDGFVGELVHDFTFADERYVCNERYFICRLSAPDQREPLLNSVEKVGIVGVEWVGPEEVVNYPPDYLEPPELLEMLRRLGRLPSEGDRAWPREALSRSRGGRALGNRYGPETSTPQSWG